jgi:hypothetical protein
MTFRNTRFYSKVFFCWSSWCSIWFDFIWFDLIFFYLALIYQSVSKVALYEIWCIWNHFICIQKLVIDIWYYLFVFKITLFIFEMALFILEITLFKFEMTLFIFSEWCYLYSISRNLYSKWRYLYSKLRYLYSKSRYLYSSSHYLWSMVDYLYLVLFYLYSNLDGENICCIVYIFYRAIFVPSNNIPCRVRSHVSIDQSATSLQNLLVLNNKLLLWTSRELPIWIIGYIT